MYMYVLKALCPYIRHNYFLNELISSKIQLKWAQEVRARPISRIVHGSARRSNACSAKTFATV